jgi:hypothetical protein
MSSKRLEIKLTTEKKGLKTIISGLGDFIEGTEIKDLIKKMQETLNCKIAKVKNNNELDGNQIENIREFLISNTSITNDMIFIEDETKQEEKNGHENNNVLDKINKKITLHFIKEGRASRTYIVGLKIFLDNDEKELMTKKLQKILGTNSVLNDEGDCGFNGNYINDTTKKSIIRNTILENPKITEDLIEF